MPTTTKTPKMNTTKNISTPSTQTNKKLITDDILENRNPILLNDAEISEFVKTCGSLKPSFLKIPEVVWRYAVWSVLRGHNLLLMGASGFGKTTVVRAVCQALNRRLEIVPCGQSQDALSTLVGNTHYDKEKGTFVARAQFIKALETPHCVILLDELSRAHPDAHNILMPVLDYTQRYLRIDQEKDTPIIPVAEGVCFTATANVGTEYTATRVMDRALLDRFSVLVLEPPTKPEEQELLTELYPLLDNDLIKAVTEISEGSRKEVKTEQPRIDTMISTRKVVEMGNMLMDGFTLAEVAELQIYPFYDDAGGADSPRSFVKQLVQRFIVDPNKSEKEAPFTPTPQNMNTAATPWDPTP